MIHQDNNVRLRKCKKLLNFKIQLNQNLAQNLKC